MELEINTTVSHEKEQPIASQVHELAQKYGHNAVVRFVSLTDYEPALENPKFPEVTSSNGLYLAGPDLQESIEDGSLEQYLQ